jgi:hypothetical protein
MGLKELKFESPYYEDLAGILRFAKFAEAEEALLRLESLRQKYQSADDAKGVEYCRRIARLGRHRAEIIHKNPKVNLSNRLRKQEIIRWFEIWLETPEIFHAWLEMRKGTSEFQTLIQSEAEDSSPK